MLDYTEFKRVVRKMRLQTLAFMKDVIHAKIASKHIENI